MMGLIARVGSGIGILRMVIPGAEQVIATGPCAHCDGKGYITHDRWVVQGESGVKANFGYVEACWKCDRTGDIVTAIYTRGVSLPPFVGATK